MDRQRALGIMGLPEGATTEEINKRAEVLYKKFRQIEKDENGNTLTDVENAYNFLNGIEFRDEKAEAEKIRRKEHPRAIFKFLKIDEDKVRNTIYYYKWTVLISIAVITLIVSFVVSIVTQEKPDLKIIVAGNTYIEDAVSLEERIEKDVTEVKTALVQNIALSENSDSQMDMAMQQKFVVEIAAGQNDVYILDEDQYQRIAAMGALKPVSEVLGDLSKLGITPEELNELKVAVKADEGEPTNEPDVYGVDVSDSKILRESGLKGERLIAAFPYQGEFPDNAVAFVKKLLE